MRFGTHVLVVVFLVASGCGDDSPDTPPPPPSDGGGTDSGSNTDAGGADSGSGTGWGFATIAPACGPADGAALRLRLYESGAGCDGDPTSESLEIYLFNNLPVEAPETFTIGQDLSSDGTVMLCPEEGSFAPCVSPESGTVTFDTYEMGVGGTGSFDLSFAAGRPDQRGTFDATWCAPPTPLMCG